MPETAKSSKEEKESLTIVVFSGDLDRALSAFTIATGAASMGMHVTLFFTFWGLNILKKNNTKIRGKGIKRKLLNIMNKGGSERLPLSKLNMFGAGSWMMKELMKESNVLSVDEMIKLAKELGVKFVACTTTLEIMGLTKDALIPEVDTLAGVSTYLNEAKSGKINLFI